MVGGGSLPLSVQLLQNVTGKIGKAFNVMQYLSNHPIKIKPNQSLYKQTSTVAAHLLCAAEPHNVSECLLPDTHTAQLF